MASYDNSIPRTSAESQAESSANNPHSDRDTDYKGVENVDPNSIVPVNDVTDKAKYDYLVTEFKKNGYSGRPIVAVGDSENSVALTGSHRILAARETANIDTHADDETVEQARHLIDG